MPRRSKLRETLICQLLRRIEEHRRERHFVLPSIRAMAREQGVAYETMWRAVDQCRRRGLLTIVAGGKVRIGPKVSATEAKAAQPNSDVCVGSHVRGGTRLEQTTARLRDALTSGAYAQAPRLPPYKVLASEYGASYRVLRAALEVLAQEQLVEQCIGGFRRTRLAPPPRETNSVLLFTGALRGHQKHGFSFSRNNDLLRALEHASSTAGLRLIRVSIRPDSGEWLPHLHADRLKHVRGCLLWTQGLIGSVLPAVVSRVCASRLPVSLLDETGRGLFPEARSATSLVRVFGLGTTSTAGTSMAHHLLSFGHQRVAYFSTLTTDVRLQGIRRAFQSEGDAERVSVHMLRPRYLSAMRRRTRLLASAGARIQALSRPPEVIDARTRMLHGLRSHVYPVLEAEMTYRALKEPVRQALADGRITALVGCNDMAALQCLNHLEEMRIAVPERISVVGFDNTPEASSRDLTSYEFNVTGLAHAMVHHVVRPSMRRECKGTPGFFEPPGTVIERASSGPAAPALT